MESKEPKRLTDEEIDFFLEWPPFHAVGIGFVIAFIACALFLPTGEGLIFSDLDFNDVRAASAAQILLLPQWLQVIIAFVMRNIFMCALIYGYVIFRKIFRRGKANKKISGNA